MITLLLPLALALVVIGLLSGGRLGRIFGGVGVLLLGLPLIVMAIIAIAMFAHG